VGSQQAIVVWRSLVNTGALWPGLDEAESRVLAMQTKLHRWAVSDPDRRFDDLHNLVYDPAFLVVAWARVRVNKGARTAGVDGVIPSRIADPAQWLAGLQTDLKARRFGPDRVRERMIPKRGGKLRRLGIPTAADRVVQASLKLVMEPIFEADFKPCSYGFRPKPPGAARSRGEYKAGEAEGLQAANVRAQPSVIGAYTGFTDHALRMLRDGGHFQWSTVTLLGLAIYVYAVEIERQRWDIVLAGSRFGWWTASTRSSTLWCCTSPGAPPSGRSPGAPTISS